MDRSTIQAAILVLAIFGSGIFFYNITGNVIVAETYNVTRVIDGDTIEIEGGHKVRLIGINTPEKGIPYANDATTFLEEIILYKYVELENHGADRYGRILGHVFIGGAHINEEILKQGLGTLYYYEKDSYFDDLEKAEEQAQLQETNIWEKSSKYGCLELLELQYEEEGERCSNGERVIIRNTCNEPIQFIYKDDATHIYYEIIGARATLQTKFSCIWNDAGDSLYAFDQEGLLIFYRYS